MKAVILCAGYATRLYPLTLDKPKTLLPIKGKPLLNHIIEKIPESVEKIFVVTNNKFYMNFVWWLETQNFKDKVEIIEDGTINNETRLGGIGDLNFVINEKKIDDDILVILGDNFFDFSLGEFVDFYDEKKKTTIGVFEFEKEKAKNFGVVEIDREGKVIGLEEKPEKPKTNLVITGIYIFLKSDVGKIKAYIKTELNKEGPTYLVKYLIENKSVYAYKFKGKWHDIGSLEEYEKLR